MHYTNELIFERPDALTDRTAHIFAAGAAGPSPFTIVITKSAVEAADTLAIMMDRIEEALAASLEDYRRTAREDGEVAGQPAVLLRFQWMQNGNPLYQKQAAFIADTASGRTLIQVAATATGEATAEQAASFDRMIATMTLRPAD